MINNIIRVYINYWIDSTTVIITYIEFNSYEQMLSFITEILT